jgi:hypothetical protein
MTECPGFDVVPTRLMERRGLDVTTLPGQACVPEAVVWAVLGGAGSGQAELRRLAAALGMHKADLLAIAWADVARGPGSPWTVTSARRFTSWPRTPRAFRRSRSVSSASTSG